MSATTANGEHPPSWKEFLVSAADKCESGARSIRQALSRGDYLACCQYIKNRLGNDEWIELLEAHFLKKPFKASELHEHVFRLDAPLVLTPNFDKIYDSFANQKSDNTIKIKKYTDEDISRIARHRYTDRAIVKVHGTIEEPTKLVFTMEDYAKAKLGYPAFYQLLDALLLTRTFLFLGCGMTDPDLLLLLERCSFFHKNMPPHYVVTAQPISSDQKSLYLSNYNLKTIPYSPKSNHQELVQLVKGMADKCDEVRAAEVARGVIAVA